MKIVQKMSAWSMKAQGVPIGKEPEPITEGLQTLLHANRMVKKAKEKAIREARKRQNSPEIKEKEQIQLTLPERTIAALFVAANFEGNHPHEVDVLGMHKDNVVVCIDKNKM